MDEKQRTRISKFLSFVLRHEPASIGIALDAAGWVDVDALLRAAADHGQPLTRDELSLVVATSPKRRFAFSEDGSRIRASQGHTTQVDLGYEPAEPPAVLFHGTVKLFLSQIRDHVHLSADEATAHAVGSRRGKPVILRVDAEAMRNAGHVFFVTPNAVWLTEAVPSEFLSGLESG